ncbi:MAG TPA: hypothetical protein VHZ25_15205 [Acidobacteriaceae bacterium]|jgi:hypothetical protein|nr:hypothetical protein [Acidobacteriaceae bacterium]
MNSEKMNDAMGPGQTVIDAALRSIGSATPASGFEGRILTRLAAERMEMETAPARGSVVARLGVFPTRALGLMTACLLGFVVVAGSVSHSRRMKPGQGAAPPTLVMPGQGIGAASAVHPAAPASAPVPASQPGRSARPSSPGRARIAPHARKAPGVAVPSPASSRRSSDSQN